MPASVANLGGGFDTLAVAVQLYLHLRIVDIRDDGGARLTVVKSTPPVRGRNAVERAFETIARWTGLHPTAQACAAGTPGLSAGNVARIFSREHTTLKPRRAGRMAEWRHAQCDHTGGTAAPNGSGCVSCRKNRRRRGTFHPALSTGRSPPWPLPDCSWIMTQSWLEPAVCALAVAVDMCGTRSRGDSSCTRKCVGCACQAAPARFDTKFSVQLGRKLASLIYC